MDFRRLLNICEYDFLHSDPHLGKQEWTETFGKEMWSN